MLGPKLGLLVKAKNLKQKDLADEVGLSEQALSRFLRGKSALNSSALDALLKVLGIDLSRIADEELKKMTSKASPVDQAKGLLADLQSEQLKKLKTWFIGSSKTH